MSLLSSCSFLIMISNAIYPYAKFREIKVQYSMPDIPLGTNLLLYFVKSHYQYNICWMLRLIWTNI